ncbi:MAG TPA: response regulator [Polyangiaceae bacterium]|nr:response regulator [Polyangiaceae bacterium]
MQSPPRLLVVEDDLTVARALSRTLARAGFSVASARSCSAARSLAQSFDVAILDLDLPDGNGVDLARALMSTGKVPTVLFFTSCTDATLLARARRLGHVVAKSLGTSPILAWLTPVTTEVADAPQSGTARRSQARSQRASSSSSLRRARAR